MPVSSSFLTFVLDQLDGLGDVTPRRMFGAVGLYCGDLFFAILDDDVLYLKVGDANRRRHEEAGMEPFKPYPDRPETMQYYGVPVGVLEDAEDLVRWARAAVDAAARARAKKPSRPRGRGRQRRAR